MKTSLLLTTLLVSEFAVGGVLADSLRQATTVASSTDWEARLPVLIVIVVFVLIVDAVFVIPALRKLNAPSAQTPPAARLTEER